MTRYAALLLSGLTLQGAAPAVPDLTLYQHILQRYVTGDGRVRYAELHRDLGPLQRFVDQIGTVSPDSDPSMFPSRQSQLSYWLNAYNALVLYSFAKDYPEDKDRLSSRLGRARFFYWTKFSVGGKKRTLDDIETRSVRYEFREPRVHFALVCGALGSPWLSREPYHGDRLEAQLEQQTAQFLKQSRNARVEEDSHIITLSEIFDWYIKDFGANQEQVLRFVAKYRPDDGRWLRAGRWRVKYFPYDWTLNDAAMLLRPQVGP